MTKNMLMTLVVVVVLIIIANINIPIKLFPIKKEINIKDKKIKIK